MKLEKISKEEITKVLFNLRELQKVKLTEDEIIPHVEINKDTIPKLLFHTQALQKDNLTKHKRFTHFNEMCKILSVDAVSILKEKKKKKKDK